MGGPGYSTGATLDAGFRVKSLDDQSVPVDVLLVLAALKKRISGVPGGAPRPGRDATAYRGWLSLCGAACTNLGRKNIATRR
jgi:hypothetical protein